MSSSELYYNPTNPSDFSISEMLPATTLKKNKSDVRAGLELQDTYKQHRPVRRRIFLLTIYCYKRNGCV